MPGLQGQCVYQVARYALRQRPSSPIALAGDDLDQPSEQDGVYQVARYALRQRPSSPIALAGDDLDQPSEQDEPDVVVAEKSSEGGHLRVSRRALNCLSTNVSIHSRVAELVIRLSN